jgi:Lipocalin-like domain
MQRARMLALRTIVLSLGMVLSASGVSAQTAKDLVGAWTTVSVTVEQGDKKIEPMGPNPKGTQIYDASGRFAYIQLRGDLPKVASNNLQTATPEESEKIARGSIAYFGSWTANDADKTVTVKIEGATFPNYVGTEQKRQYAISGDQLTITNPMHAVGGGVLKIVLTRAK